MTETNRNTHNTKSKLFLSHYFSFAFTDSLLHALNILTICCIGRKKDYFSMNYCDSVTAFV